MNRQQLKQSLLHVLLVVIGALGTWAVIAVAAGESAGQPAGPALGTAFTYQGRLEVAGGPVDGTCDLRFTLFDMLAGGTPSAGPLTVSDVAVAAGLFTVQLEFGAVFDGSERYLEIEVRCPAGAGAYETIVPRQQLQPAPYAIYSGSSPWSGLVGVPAGFDDDVDDDTTYSPGAGLVLNDTTFSAQGSPYANVVVVAQSGGDFTAIQDALDSITNAGVNNRYLIWIAPGVYSELVLMKDFVDIEGAGRELTRITFVGQATNTRGTLRGADNAELRHLTVENTGGNNYAYAINNSGGVSPRLVNVSAVASGGSSETVGVRNLSGASAYLERVVATASGGAISYGIYNFEAEVSLVDVTATASGASSLNYGIFIEGGSPIMRRVSASASGGANTYGIDIVDASPDMMTVSGAGSAASSQNAGIRIFGSGTPMLNDISATASGDNTSNFAFLTVNFTGSPPPIANLTASATGNTNNYGVYVSGGNLAFEQLTATAAGGSSNYGVYYFATGGSYESWLNHATISGSTNSIRHHNAYTATVSGAQLGGGPVNPNGGAITCVQSYDDSGQSLADNCAVEAEDGRALAAVFAFCDSSDATLHRYYNRAGSTVTIENGFSTGECYFNFDFDTFYRYWTAMVYSGTTESVGCNPDGLQRIKCTVFDDTGTKIGRDIMLVIH